MSDIKVLNVRYSNDKCQNYQTSNCLMFDIRMSKVKLFHVRMSNDEHQTNFSAILLFEYSILNLTLKNVDGQQSLNYFNTI